MVDYIVDSFMVGTQLGWWLLHTHCAIAWKRGIGENSVVGAWFECTSRLKNVNWCWWGSLLNWLYSISYGYNINLEGTFVCWGSGIGISHTKGVFFLIPIVTGSYSVHPIIIASYLVLVSYTCRFSMPRKILIPCIGHYGVSIEYWRLPIKYLILDYSVQH